MEYQRRGLTEWYVNGPMGIEQGFTAPAPPEGVSRGGALTLRLVWSGDARVEVAQNEAVVSNSAGEPLLRYSGLSARDASGKDLRAWIERRGSSILLRVDDREATYPVVIDPYIQQQKLTADEFGDSVALSSDGRVALVGAPFAVLGVLRMKGAAYVFVRSGGTWSQQQKLTADDGLQEFNFGASVALSSDGSTALIGAPRASVSGKVTQGAAYVFVRSGGTWSQQQKLTASDGLAGDYLGMRAALSSDGSTALIGAIFATVGGNSQQGAAYVFVNNNGTWSSQKLVAPDGAASDWFGYSAALSADGSTALIGAAGASVSGKVTQGAAYVFVKSGGIWSQQQKLTASDGLAGDSFGCSTALSSDGSTALIGAYSVNAYQGAAYVFVNSGGTWTQQQKLTASDGAASDQFGQSVALSADGAKALIGASGGNSHQGAAYVFVNNNGTWNSQKLVASGGAAGDSFGWSVALSSDGNTALIGEFGANSQQGAAYVFNSHGLAVNFGASGLWFYRDGAWSELTSLSPGMMAAYGSDMVAVFPGAGLYQYDCAAWTQLTPISIIDLIAGMPDRVYVDFTGAGLWQYNGAWAQITPLNPDKMIAFGGKLLANFPDAGLFQYDGATWTQLTPLSFGRLHRRRRHDGLCGFSFRRFVRI